MWQVYAYIEFGNVSPIKTQSRRERRVKWKLSLHCGLFVRQQAFWVHPMAHMCSVLKWSFLWRDLRPPPPTTGVSESTSTQVVSLIDFKTGEWPKIFSGFCPHPVTVYDGGHIQGYRSFHITILFNKSDWGGFLKLQTWLVGLSPSPN